MEVKPLSKGNEYLKEWLEGKEPKGIFLPHLFNDLKAKVKPRNIFEETDHVTQTYEYRVLIFKALTTYRKGTRAGKTELAKKIMKKYGLGKLLPLRDDVIMSLAMSIGRDK